MATAAQVYTMLGNADLWETARKCHELLESAKIPYAIVGGVAVCMHGYQRNTVDLDLLVRAEDSSRVQTLFAENGLTWDVERKEFLNAAGIPVQFLLAGERAGSGSEVLLPDPGDVRAVTQIESLSVLSLAKLIESKLACGQGNARRTHKDFADVVELIAKHDLGRDFARHLHRTLRRTYRELVLAARGGK